MPKEDLHLKKVKSRIQRVVKWHEDKFHGKWDRYVDLYAMRHYPNQVSDQERVQVGITFSVVNVIVPAVTHSYPNILVAPKKPEYEAAAVIAEHVVNTEWRHLKVKRQIRKAVKDAVIMGTGVMKVGWRRLTKELPRTPEDMSLDFDRARTERDTASEEYTDKGDADMAKSLPTDDDLWMSIPISHPALTNDELFVERLSPKDVFVDPDATDPHNMKYCFQRVVKSLDEVKANKAYDQSVVGDLKPDTRSQAFTGKDVDAAVDEKNKDEDIQRVTLYEYWDMETHTYCVYAENGKKPLLGPKKWPYGDFFPFIFFHNNDVPDEFWGIGEVEAIESQQLELNKTRSQMLNQRRQYNRKVLVKNGAFSTRDLDELRSDKDGVFVPVKPNVPLNEAIYILQPPQIDAQLYQTDDVIRRDITETTSVSEYQRGMLPNLKRTATEASLIESAASVRAQDKVSRAEEFMADIARGMLIVMSQLATDARMVRAVGKDGAQIWFTYNGELIGGEYNIEVEAGSTQPVNESVRKQEALEMLQVLGAHPLVNQEELLKHVLKAYKLSDPDRFIAQPTAVAPGSEQGPLPPEGGEAAPPGAAPGEGADLGQEWYDTANTGKNMNDLLNQIAGQVGAPV